MSNFYHGYSINQPLNDLTQHQADLSILVLESQGIKADIKKQNNLFEIVIEENLETRAHDILEKYYYENMKSLNDFKEQIPPLPAKKITPVLIVLALLMIHLGCEYAGVHKNIILEYGSSALYILQGEYYRIFTALMLHADIEHLAGNIAGILIFGIPLCTITGSIQGFCLLAASGAAGNLINAWMYRTAHLSIGASTSVMGAAGLLVAFQMKKKAAVKGFKPSIFLPLGAGAALVGMLSGGENTDVSAHIFGFASGLVMGGLVSFFIWIKEAK